MSLQTSRLLQLPVLLSPGRDNWIEVVYNGQNYRAQLGPVANLAQQQAPGTASKYWVATPSYVIDVDSSVNITSTARIYYNGQENTVAAVNDIGTLPPLLDPLNKRFDGLLFDTINEVYIVVNGSEAQNPATPSYNNDRYMLLSWLLISDEGVTVEEPPQTHPQNTDQYLDKGGTSQVSAGQAKSAYDKSRYFAGKYDEVADLPAALTVDSFALVGISELTFYVYSVDTGLWTQQKSGGGQEISFAVFSDLDTVSASKLFQGAYTLDSVFYDSKLSGISFELRLDTASSWTAAADLAEAQSWINSNVSGASVKWLLRIVATFAGGQYGEATVSLKYSA